MAPAKKKVTSSAERSKRQKASKAKVSGANASSRANRQKVSTAQTTSDASRGTSSTIKRITGDVQKARKQPSSVQQSMRLGARTDLTVKNPQRPLQGPARATAPKSPRPQTRQGSLRLAEVTEGTKSRNNALRQALTKPGRTAAKPATVASVGREVAGNLGRAVGRGLRKSAPLATAAAVLAPRRAADGTLKGKPRLSADRPSNKPSAKEKATAKSFPKSFKKARSEGSKVFMWKGKKYNTKRADGK
jgi:hypothetical protein